MGWQQTRAPPAVSTGWRGRKVRSVRKEERKEEREEGATESQLRINSVTHTVISKSNQQPKYTTFVCIPLVKTINQTHLTL